MAKGRISPDGTMTITFNVQRETLDGPTKGFKWFPCEWCGNIDEVRANVVSYRDGGA